MDEKQLREVLGTTELPSWIQVQLTVFRQLVRQEGLTTKLLASKHSVQTERLCRTVLEASLLLSCTSAGAREFFNCLWCSVMRVLVVCLEGFQSLRQRTSQRPKLDRASSHRLCTHAQAHACLQHPANGRRVLEASGRGRGQTLRFINASLRGCLYARSSATQSSDRLVLQFPDFERVGWFNDIVGQLWPYVNSAVSAMARDRMDPMLQESKPSWIRSIKLYRQGGVRACVSGGCQ